MKGDGSSSLGCCTLTDSDDDSLEDQLRDAEEGETRRPEREEEEAPLNKRMRVMNGV